MLGSGFGGKPVQKVAEAELKVSCACEQSDYGTL